MATLQFDFNTDTTIRDMFGINHTSTIKHPSVNDINLDLFVDGLHDKLARIFCSIDKQGGRNNTRPCPLTVEEDDLFQLPSKNQPPGVNDETVIEHFKSSVVTKTVIPLFDNINQNELRIKDIFKFFFLLCFSNLIDPADTSGENFIKHLRKKTNNPNITLPFDAAANNNIFDILSQHTYSMCGDKLLYAYILRLYPTINFPGNPLDPWSAGGNTTRNVRERHLVILNFVWQCTLAYIQSISRNDARFPAGSFGHNPNFPNQGEINAALGILQQIQFVGFILQTPTQAVENNINDYRHYTYANATFIFRGEATASAVPFAVSQGIAAECINELYPDLGGAALPREGSPHQYKVQCKAKLQQYINGRVTTAPVGSNVNYIKSVIYVLLKFAGDTSHLVNYMLLKNAIQGIRLGQGAQPVLPANGFFRTDQLKTTIFCCERALIARCIQENHSFYCRDVKVLSQEVPLALGDCYYFNVNPNEKYVMKLSLLASFNSVAGDLQDDIDTAIINLNAFIDPNQPNPNANQEERIEQLITFVNFYKAYKKFVLFIKSSSRKYNEFITSVFPSHFKNRSATSRRAGKILNMLTPLTLLHGNIKNKKRFELTSLIYSAYYGPLVSILSQLQQEHIKNDIRTMGMEPDILETLQTVQSTFRTKINITGLQATTEEEIRDMLNPENNLNDTKSVETLLNIISSQRYIDDNLQQMIANLRVQFPAAGGGAFMPPSIEDGETYPPLFTKRDETTTPPTIDVLSNNKYKHIIYKPSYPEEFIKIAETQPQRTDFYTKENLITFILKKIVDHINVQEEHNNRYRGIDGHEYRGRSSRYGREDRGRSRNRRRSGYTDNINAHHQRDTSRSRSRSRSRDRSRSRRYSEETNNNGITNIESDSEDEDERFQIIKNYNFDLLIEYFASMVEYEITQNILDEALQEKIGDLLEIFRSYIQPPAAAEAIVDINRLLHPNDQVNDQYLNALLNWGIQSIQINSDIDQELEPLPDALRNITGTFLPPRIAWGWPGGKNIRSVSKMYRKNNKNVKKVKKTRKIKKNNYKKSKTSKRITKTSVQNKKYNKGKGIKNMKNTKNKKVNKSKTKKSKKN